MNATEVFAQRLRLCRQRKGISLQKAAEALGATAQSLSLYEKGQRTINIDLLKRVAEYFGVTSDYLIGLSDAATTDTDLKAVCDYTGLSEKSTNLLYLLNQIKQLAIEEFHPALIDVIDMYLSKMDSEHPHCLFKLRDAINVEVKEDDTKTEMKIFEVMQKYNSTSWCVSGATYRNFLIQEYKDEFADLTYSVIQSMTNENIKSKCISSDLEQLSLSQACQNILDSNTLIKELAKEALDNGNDTTKKE